MKTYEELVCRYRRRNRGRMAMDAAAAGLPYLDELAEAAGLQLWDDLTADVLDAAGLALPFVVIAATEGGSVLAKRKPAATGVMDGACRMAKSAVALGLGAAAANGIGAWAALPAAAGVRLLLEYGRSSLLTIRRVQGRIERLQALNLHIARQNGNLIESASSERIPPGIVEE